MRIFLSLINGIDTTPIVLIGKFKKKIIWKYYPSIIGSPFGHHEGFINYKPEGLNTLWKFVASTFGYGDERDVLNTTLNWYISANANPVYVEGAIVNIQNALELLFNFVIVEKKGILLDDDSEKLSATSKIKLLLNELKATSQIPQKFTSLINFAHSIKKDDGPGVFTEIRNAIVHGQKSKRVKLKAAAADTRIQAKNLGLWYIELIILFLANYDGRYRNRCTNTSEKVPWA